MQNFAKYVFMKRLERNINHKKSLTEKLIKSTILVAIVCNKLGD